MLSRGSWHEDELRNTRYGKLNGKLTGRAVATGEKCRG